MKRLRLMWFTFRLLREKTRHLTAAQRQEVRREFLKELRERSNT